MNNINISILNIKKIIIYVNYLNIIFNIPYCLKFIKLIYDYNYLNNIIICDYINF